MHRSETKLIVDVDVKTHDAPYGDTFTCKEAWIVMAKSGNESRSILQTKARVAFVKSTMWKSKIEARATEGLKETHALWVKHVKSKGHLEKKAVLIQSKAKQEDPKENTKESSHRQSDKVDAENAKKRLEEIKGDEVKEEEEVAVEEPAMPLQSSSPFQPTMFNIVSFLIVILLCICLNLCFSLKKEQSITNTKMESLASQLDRIERLLS